ncbi:MAG: molybdopterin converting factor small subunit [Candidatus Binatia bacterium]|jgi:molybdopterin converting factor small subunit
MQIPVQFYSYFKDLTGCESATESLDDGATIQTLMERLFEHFPRLAEMPNSILVAVGVEYQLRDYELRAGDEVSLFPPVQGG